MFLLRRMIPWTVHKYADPKVFTIHAGPGDINTALGYPRSSNHLHGRWHNQRTEAVPVHQGHHNPLQKPLRGPLTHVKRFVTIIPTFTFSQIRIKPSMDK